MTLLFPKTSHQFHSRLLRAGLARDVFCSMRVKCLYIVAPTWVIYMMVATILRECGW